MLLSSITQKQIDNYCTRPDMPLLLETAGDESTGMEIVEYLHKQFVGDSSSPLLFIERENALSIGIADVRSLQRRLTLQANATSHASAVSRIAVIPQAELLTREAQNALLKVLEELPARTILCLLVNNSQLLLSTVISRCVLLRVIPLIIEAATVYAVSKGYEAKEISRAYMLSEGRATQFKALLEDPDHPYVQLINQAKEYIAASTFTRQKLNADIVKTSSEIPQFLQALRLVARAGMQHAGDITTKKAWMQRVQTIVAAHSALNQNGSVKLVLLNLSLQLK